MPRQQGHREGKCTVCRHAERPRIDYLIAAGSEIKPLGQKFRLGASALYNHAKRHISTAYIRAIKIGPFESEEQLRKLCAEAGTSVVQNLDAIYGGLASRWLANFESGADNKLAQLTDRMLRTLELKARITKEVMPPGATLNQTLIVTPDIVNAVQAMKPTPEQREAFARAWRQIAPRVLIEHVAAAD